MNALLRRLLDASTRADVFEPAYHEALATHIAAQRGRGPLVRRMYDLAFPLRTTWILLESLRLQALRTGPPRTRRNPLMSLTREVRLAVRGLRKRPAFTFLAVLTLALGVGANAAVFSVVNAVLLRALPYADADRLVVVWGDNTTANSVRDPHAVDTFLDYRNGLDGAETVAAITPQWNITLLGDDADVVPGYFASAEFLPMLGARAAQGRLFGPDDDRAEAAPVVVISHGLWQRRFAGGDVIGRTMPTSAGTATIIGVLPASFRWREEADVWIPLAHNPFWTSGRRVRLLEIIAKRSADAAPAQLRVQAQELSARLAAGYPENLTGIRARVVPLHEDIVGDVRPVLLLMFSAAGFVMLIACVNVAHLLLVRGDARRREVAVRAALGASRAQIARELLAEGALLSLAGAAIGLLLAVGGVRVLFAFLPPGLPRQSEIGVDGSVLLFAIGLAVLTGALFSLAPLLESMRSQPGAALNETERATGGARGRARGVLVMVEVALALVVAIAASLLVRSFASLQRVDPGFETEHVLAMDLSGLPTAPEQQIALMEGIYARLDALPFVVAAGEVTRVPLSTTSSNVTSSLQIEHRPVPQGEEPSVDFRRASRGYFDAMQIPLLRGRPFQASDALPDAQPVALINEVAAQQFFPNEDPIGKRVRFGGSVWLTIVGVVGAIHHTSLAEAPRPEGYIHTVQGPASNPRLLVRTAGEPLEHLEAVRNAIRAQDPGVVLSNVTTMEQIRSTSLATPRFQTLLFTLFALLALVLATVGTYGVMAYTVAQRTREIGVRMSLGARPHDVARMVVREGLRLAAVGLAVGVIAAFALARTLRGLLFAVSPTDPATFAATTALLLATVLAACWITARRAAAVDPIRALRQE